ncbi:hypothetical protein DE146DRAFT_616768 [Phaeosphaeria sp. MPI-PUGE-AT-0046c]|nr:hypothetical protein DE146DRAFT_616768 [Phaeosphaeria sp. MPI-PUGE-AT-0046c]
MAQKPMTGLIGRARSISVTLANGSPQLGMWQATGTAIAQAPNLTELREPETGGSNIEFDEHGHSTRIAKPAENGDLELVKAITAGITPVPEEQEDPKSGGRGRLHRTHTLREKQDCGTKAGWGPTIMNGFKAFWKFFKTFSGFCITIYFLNIVAWGAMLFFLLLKAAPAMNHPTADDDSSPRKIWLEIDSQILNALFCVTGFGLAPWRFRDWYWMVRVVHFQDRSAMYRLTQQNKGWFRPAEEYEEAIAIEHEKDSVAFNGVRAPPTPLWKLAFVIDMMVLNTALQAVLCYFMWGYNRINRPPWATGTFIALGCGSAMFAGLMSWWEGRKVKKIEGPEVKIMHA